MESIFFGAMKSSPPHHPDSNYHMAMQAGLSKMPIPKEQIHRMRAEDRIEEHALDYEQLIGNTLKGRPFDLVMLGIGEDGHTASLFPNTEGLDMENRSVIANFIPKKKVWRMTLTFTCINNALNSVIYALGASKKRSWQKFFSLPLLQIIIRPNASGPPPDAPCGLRMRQLPLSSSKKRIRKSTGLWTDFTR